jgi:sugar O-acyltransferase (sialic acid O-acetyltransferase NeuD family)
MASESDRTRTSVLIVGAGGQGRIVADILLAGRKTSGLTPIGFVDDREERAGSTLLGLPILGTVGQMRGIPHDAIVVAIGDNHLRQQVTLGLEAAGERLATATHPWTSIAADVVIGAGAMISAGAVIAPGARIGRGVLVNTNASIDHETRVDEFAHVSAGATVGGNVTIGARTLVGLAAAVMSGCQVGADCVVGAGALVHRDLPDNVVAVGVPARIRRQPR